MSVVRCTHHIHRKNALVGCDLLSLPRCRRSRRDIISARVGRHFVGLGRALTLQVLRAPLCRFERGRGGCKAAALARRRRARQVSGFFLRGRVRPLSVLLEPLCHHGTGSVPPFELPLACHVLGLLLHYRWTPLHWAASHGDVAAAEMLLSHGADVHAETEGG